jgi:hypothetical protein
MGPRVGETLQTFNSIILLPQTFHTTHSRFHYNFSLGKLFAKLFLSFANKTERERERLSNIWMRKQTEKFIFNLRKAFFIYVSVHMSVRGVKFEENRKDERRG